MADDFKLIYVTCSSLEEAKSIARPMVESKLAACANIFPEMISIYPWDGRIHESKEVVLLLKSHSKKLEKVYNEIISLHSYKCPCIFSLPMEDIHNPYSDWLVSSLGGNLRM